MAKAQTRQSSVNKVLAGYFHIATVRYRIRITHNIGGDP